MAQTKELKILGVAVDLDFDENERRFQKLLKIQAKARVRVTAERDTDAVVQLPNIATDDVLDLELEGGFHLFARRDDFEQDFRGTLARGNGEQLVLGPGLDLGSPSRGAREWLIKLVDIFGAKAAETSAVKLAETFEGQVVKTPGLFRVGSDGVDGAPISKLGGAAAQPLLLLIHGTASSTSGSFGGLWEPQNHLFWQRLQSAYSERIYAYEHHTLAQHPLDNVLQLLPSLPDNATLHLLTQSRGGLIGELLALGTVAGDPLSAREISLFETRAKRIVDALAGNEAQEAKQAFERQVRQLRELASLLREKNIRIKRFVRVACPVRGTTLASGRLDRWLSIFFNLVGLVPALAQSPYYALLKSFALALVRTRTKPQHLPGLEAQMPGSPLIGLLNGTSRELAADLSVIAGDLEQDGLLGRLALLLPDRFYGTDHDLVVNTPSMYGGGPREEGMRHFTDQGSDVHHFNYFRNERTAALVVEGLTAEKDDLPTFFPSKPVDTDTPIPRAAPGLSPGFRPVLFLLPGIMGSKLEVDDRTVWLHRPRLALGQMRKLGIDAIKVVPDGVMAADYTRLLKELGATHEVVLFDYDWRLSLADEAKRFARVVGKKLEQIETDKQPLRILAHSMGGLLVRAMQVAYPGVWDAAMAHPESRFVMLGTPNGGSFAIPRMLLGQEKLVRLLALIDLKNSQQQLLRIIVRYPGVLDLLPETGNDLDLFSRQTWERIGKVQGRRWPLPSEQDLQQARKLRTLISSRPLSLEPNNKVIYVAGQADQTPVALSIEKDKVIFQGTPRGDGRVPWSTGIPSGVTAYYMAAAHGDLADHKAAFPAIQELLAEGRTERLPDRPPALARGVEELFDMAPDQIDYYPDTAELQRAAAGATRRKEKPQAPTVKLWISHGDLAFARHAVAVGHYAQDGLFSAESYLDRQLDGKLSHRLALGVYPGPLNSCEILFNREGVKPCGAIVVGLGEVGKLTVSSLRHTFSYALRTYAIRWRAEAAERKDPKPRSLGVSALLIGASAGGLPLPDALRALLEGMLDANRLLRQECDSGSPRIAELEIVEIWEDNVINAQHVLRDLFDFDQELKEHFDLQAVPKILGGARYRAYYEEAKGWWRRLQVRSDRRGTLIFHTLTDAARTELILQAENRDKVDLFLRRATDGSKNQTRISQTLFEMLLPNELKDRFERGGDTVLLLDENSARYPWELLEDRYRLGDSLGDEPLAVKNSVVRQLETEHYRKDPAIVYENRALVIGEPDIADQKRWPPLPGAEIEAQNVWATLNRDGRFNAEKKIKAKAVEILQALHADPYRILHLAGHGYYEDPGKTAEQDPSAGRGTERDEPVAGMVIGDDMYLTPADIDKLRHVPELVFINCCHLGNTKPSGALPRFPALAGNLGTHFIRMGVRAVIAAGWAVNDAAARCFAEKFYQGMLAGLEFGTAVHNARRETYRSFPGVNTWGAYQCYGDPHYRLVDRTGFGRPPSPKPVTAHQAVLELNNLAGRASTVDFYSQDEAVARLRAELQDLVRAIDKAGWGKQGEICAAIGNAFGELGDFEKAIAWYRSARTGKGHGLPLRALEQLANLRVREAVFRCAEEGDPRAEWRALDTQIRAAIKSLEELRRLAGDTPERLCLLGSAYKRYAHLQALAGKSPIEALQTAGGYYADAAELSEPGVDDYYPISNDYTMRALLGLCQNPERAKRGLNAWELKTLQGFEASARRRDDEDPRFWTLASAPDCALIYHLVNRSLPAQWQKIATSYLDARRRGVTPREFRSILEHLDFLIAVLDPGERARKANRSHRAKLYTALLQLRTALSSEVT